jgi:hypothetical protein
MGADWGFRDLICTLHSRVTDSIPARALDSGLLGLRFPGARGPLTNMYLIVVRLIHFAEHGYFDSVYLSTWFI